MRPTIQPGESLAVSPAARVRVGDVVAFVAADGSTQAHRIVRLDDERLWTRGDASCHDDPPIGRDHVVGIVARGGAAGAAIARWPWLAPLVGALVRVEGVADLPDAARALGAALMIRLLRR
jgi:hypothetical protein